MSFYLLKVLFTGLLVVLITEVSKVSGKIGGIITAMPLTTLLVVFWLYYEMFQMKKFQIMSKILYILYYLLCLCLLFFQF